MNIYVHYFIVKWQKYWKFFMSSRSMAKNMNECGNYCRLQGFDIIESEGRNSKIGDDARSNKKFFICSR